ncbi:hypothetical protein ACH4PU_05900 [Streptomyces sp. NPDC021100]|uniref:hypothetical protein n=1 Tax=Streptomyces sp. NPDC021100 TaxID=3365114 RepID=UPI0037A6D4E1
MYHHVLAALLLRTVRATPGITFRQGERGTAVRTAGRARATREAVTAGLVAGADGRSSTVRRVLRPVDGQHADGHTDVRCIAVVDVDQSVGAQGGHGLPGG